MGMRRSFAALAAVLLLAGCQAVPPADPVRTGAAAPQATAAAPARTASAAPARPEPPIIPTRMPRYRDALAGLYSATATQIPRDAQVTYYQPGGPSQRPGRAVLTMALVPGANYAALHGYLDQAQRDIQAAAPAFSASAQADLQVQPVLARAVEIIKQRYPWIEISPDIASAKQHTASLTLVLDLRSKLGLRAGEPTAVQVELVAFDDRMQPVSRIISEGRASVSQPGSFNFQLAARQALDAFADKAGTLLN